ncbi:hypothetical protein K227x_26480 [Rubripirellula lacrimiformis]|uniref:Uncharacterized protein n=1 Tax=Rubripirellula lacrimiformis TaxID=1930273 RepID=A0A517NB58_9BACT|nr:antitoxin Xre/MbcA/ParS toxin-binding domain-containing protein [Rubripirellula lacrimiformis]QDT04258.1 hypothetical protein K227x_26480 [Rubripirellula lacrimiformis]
MTAKTKPTAKSRSKSPLRARAKKVSPAGAGRSAIVSKRIVGLKGQGLIQFGRESKLELRDRLAMPRTMFGRIVNVSERTIAKVESSSDNADKLKRPYNEVYRLWQALSEVVDPESLGLWFQTPNDALDGLKPLEVIERGEIDRLWNMVFRLRSGMPG